jgi:hypothetical protein
MLRKKFNQSYFDETPESDGLEMFAQLRVGYHRPDQKDLDVIANHVCSKE